jgi:hypothetical protein
MPIQGSRTKSRNGKVTAIMHLDPEVWQQVKMDALRQNKPVYQYAQEVFLAGLFKMKMKAPEEQLDFLSADRDTPNLARKPSTKKRR